MKLRDWFSRYHNRPLKIAATFLMAVWFVFAYRSYETIVQKQQLAVTQISDLLSLSIGSKDRPMTESLLEALVEQSGATSAAICEDSKQFLAANQDFLGCADEKPLFESIVERPIPGSRSLRLKVTFDWIKNFAPSFAFMVFCLALVVAGFHFIRSAQRKVEKGILSPLLNRLFADEALEIDELTELRENVRKVQVIEAQKAVALAIEEHNQQVAHDIRSPIAAINELLRMVPIENPKIRSALEKALLRANSVANDLLIQDSKPSERAGCSTYDLSIVSQDIAIEKRPLFVGGSIELRAKPRLVVSTRLPQASLARILSNVIDNAMAACTDRKAIEIGVTVNLGQATIKVCDTGVGISSETLRRIGEKGFTLAKPSGKKGSGRGVYAARKLLAEVGGTIELNSTFGNGTEVVVSFPAIVVEADRFDIVLVDNEELNRMVWEMRASEAGQSLRSFDSIDALLHESDLIDKSTPVFLDSDLGNGARGENLAPLLRAAGFKRVYLTTNFVDLHDKHFAGIDAVVGKSFERALELSMRRALI